MFNKAVLVFMLCLTYLCSYTSNYLPFCFIYMLSALLHCTSSVTFAVLWSRGAPTEVQRRGQESSQEMQCHHYMTGHATIFCANHSHSKCGIDTGYPITNVTPAASLQFQIFIMYVHWGSFSLMISNELLIYRGGRPFSEPSDHLSL